MQIVEESLQTVGKRLKRVRLLAGLSAVELAEFADVGATSISLWENGKSPMTKKSMDKILAALKKRGIHCTSEWLLNEIGIEPKVIQLTQKESNQVLKNDYENLANEQTTGQLLPQTLFGFEEEIKLFFKSNPSAVIAKIEHEGMKPFIEIGDIVGGIWQPANQLQFNADKICIIEFEGKIDIRNIKTGSKAGLFHISYITYSSNLPAPFNMQDVPLTRIALLKRVWRL